jgi:hypothetical protein
MPDLNQGGFGYRCVKQACLMTLPLYKIWISYTLFQLANIGDNKLLRCRVLSLLRM